MLQEWKLSQELLETVELLVSETITNAIQASEELTNSWFDGKQVPGRPPVRLWLESDGSSVVFHVWDGNKDLPQLKQPAVTEEHGRGLFLVQALCERYGVYRLEGATGKVVWARVRT